jgi:hypothetical protein
MAKRGRPPKKTEDSTTSVENTTTLIAAIDVASPEAQDPSVAVDNSFGPTLFCRDSNGLLQNTQYTFSEDGSVDWRAMIKEEHLFPNRSWFEGRGKDMPSSVAGLKDYQLLIKLSGIKELARLRGFTEVNYEIDKCTEQHVAVKCQIHFTPNYETGLQQVVFEDIANATLNNTSSFATKFLETIACNRAFVRCVRNFLNVHIVGDDEIDKSDPSSPSLLAANKAAVNTSSMSPHGILEQKFDGFDTLKAFLRELWAKKLYRNDLVKDWLTFDDIPPKEARILLKLYRSSTDL